MDAEWLLEGNKGANCKQRVALDSMSDMQRKDTNESISRHNPGQFSIVLSEVQARNSSECDTAENDCLQRARCVMHRACFFYSQ